MALVNEPFVRCACGGAHFTRDSVFMISNQMFELACAGQAITPDQVTYTYRCARCGKVVTNNE